MKKKMGRPKLPKGTANTVLFAVKLAANEADKIQRAIRASGMRKPDWMRSKLVSGAEQT
jgi:hypothetical protein